MADRNGARLTIASMRANPAGVLGRRDVRQSDADVFWDQIFQEAADLVIRDLHKRVAENRARAIIIRQIKERMVCDDKK